MSGKYPEYRKKQEKAAQERKEAEEHSDRQQIVSALQAAIKQNQATDNQTKRADRFHRLVEKLNLRIDGRRFWVDLGGVIGIFLAAGIAIWAVVDAKSSADKQYEALRAQQAVMQGQLDQVAADQRAWMKIESISPGEDKWTGGGLRFPAKNIPGMLSLNIVIRNVGRGPAFNVRVGAWPIFGYGEKVEDLRRREEKSCTTLDGYSTEPSMDDSEGSAVVIFPGETKTITSVGVGIWPKDLAKFSTPNSARGMTFQLWFYGCIRYTLPGSSKSHETNFAYGVGHIISVPAIPGGRALDIQFDPWVSIPGAGLQFDPKPSAFGPTN